MSSSTLVVLLSTLLATASAWPAGLKLATFDGNKTTSHSFVDMNDPVMGGKSHSTWAVDEEAKAGVFAGACVIVPALKAPGFCKVSTSDAKPYPDASALFKDGSIVLRAKTTTPDYKGFKVAFGAKGAKRPTPSRHGGATFKAGFFFSNSTADWQEVLVPFHEFSIDWSDYTGDCDTKDPTGEQHYCCTDQHPEVCVTAPLLKEITSLEVWAEGVHGEFHLEIESIGITDWTDADTCDLLLNKPCGKAQKEGRPQCEACVEGLPPNPDRTLKCDFEFCDAAPGGGDSCIAVLKKDCEETRTNATKCDECVARVERAKLGDCTRQDELRFCHGEQPPSPAPPITPGHNKCIELLDADCKHHYAKQDGNLCYNCTQKALKEEPKVTCTTEEEFNFCEYGPADHPPACIEELQKLCGKPYGKQHANRTACTECVVAHEANHRWTKVNCPRAEVQQFC